MWSKLKKDSLDALFLLPSILGVSFLYRYLLSMSYVVLLQMQLEGSFLGLKIIRSFFKMKPF